LKAKVSGHRPKTSELGLATEPIRQIIINRDALGAIDDSLGFVVRISLPNPRSTLSSLEQFLHHS
jgi:hypothetical protein